MKPGLSEAATQEPGGTRPRVFNAVWQAKAHAMAELMAAQGQFSWRRWTVVLSEELGKLSSDPADEEISYYAAWQSALERVLREGEVMSDSEHRRYADAWANAFHRTAHGNPVELRDTDFT